MIALIGIGVLLGIMGCRVTREVTRSEVRSQRSEVIVDSVKEDVVVAVHDTIMEVTTIPFRTNDAGDTVRMTTVTDRDRVTDRSRNDRAMYRSMVKTDTVYVEKRDSVLIKNEEKARASPFEKSLKWIFWIIIAMIGLIVVLRFRR